MFRESTELYDAIYRDHKDYAGESERLAELIRSRSPDAVRILDVGCGTGEHARLLAERHGFAVDGIDVEERFLEIARSKVPNGEFVRVRMEDFHLGRRYDAVVSLFGSIGYVKTRKGLERSLSSMARHLKRDGVLVVEPWFEPGALQPGYVTVQTVELKELKACRMTHTDVRGRLSILRFEYLTGDAEGLRRASEVHELGLFTREETEAAFRKAGLEVEYDPEGSPGRGLYIGRPAKGSVGPG
jgi:SAM-dependent methyltransferase